MAMDFFRYYACWHREEHTEGFLTEDVVEAAKDIKILAAIDARAWGEIAKLMKTLGFIESAGFAYSSKGKGNSAPRTLWKVKS
jgi:hypothetical protein